MERLLHILLHTLPYVVCNELCSYKSICFNFFSYLLICVFVLTLNFIKNIPNVDFMVILMKFATCHVRNAFKRPLRPNAPTVRVLTSVILKGIGWAFGKLYPLKIPGMVHQGLLAPGGLLFTATKLGQVTLFRPLETVERVDPKLPLHFILSLMVPKSP